MKRHLLVAGNGFVGREVARIFRENGWLVTTLSRSGEGDEHVDLADAEALAGWGESLNRATPVSHVLHCASAGGGLEAYRSVYLAGARNLAAAFPRVHLLFTSSTSVYPQIDGSVVTEESAVETDREAGLVLLEAENVVLESGGTVLRLAGLYGVGRGYLLRQFLAGKATVEEDGGRWLNYTHNYDAASAVWFLCQPAIAARGQIFNVCDSSPRSQRETYRGLVRIFGGEYPPSVARNLQSKRGWTDKAVSNAKLVRAGWRPDYPDFLAAAKSTIEVK